MYSNKFNTEIFKKFLIDVYLFINWFDCLLIYVFNLCMNLLSLICYLLIASFVFSKIHAHISQQEEFSRKRKAPMASSVVRIQKGHEQFYESEEDEEDEEDYSMHSRVSLPPKPERKSVSTSSPNTHNNNINYY